MLPIYICEDIPERLKEMKNIAEKHINDEDLPMNVVCAAEDPYSILSYLKGHRENSLYFLDLDLKSDIDGFNLAQEIRKYDELAYIVIVTTHSELSLMTFEYGIDAMDYIVKDFGAENLKKRMLKCMKKACYRHTDTCEEISFVVKGRKKHFKINEIQYIKASDISHSAEVRMCRGISIIPYTLAEVEKQLDDRFYRCHRTSIVNLERILELDVDNRVIKLEGGINCPISKRSMKETLKKYDKFGRTKSIINS